MPFQEPFASKYTPGDFFYGLAGPRKALIDKLTNKNIQLVQEHMGWIDLYILNERWVHKQLADLKESIANAKDAVLLGRLKHSAEKWEENQRFIDALKDHEKYESAVGGYVAPFSNKWEDKAKENETWRRKSKGGLYYACKVADKTVHFCLDGFNDFKAVILKSYAGKGGGAIGDKHGGKWQVPPDRAESAGERKFRIVTGAELRWIYRYREDPDVASHIQFWHGGGKVAPCCPPWVAGFPGQQVDWSQYSPKANDIHNDHAVADEIHDDIVRSPDTTLQLLKIVEDVHTIEVHVAKVAPPRPSVPHPPLPRPASPAKTTPPTVAMPTKVSVEQLRKLFERRSRK